MNKKYKNDIVSIIIPVYNSSEYIEETLNSVVKQTYKNLEIIIIDDCSIDNSEEILQNFIKKHQKINIRYYKQKENKGVANARNKALNLAKGRFVAFLDSDDIWDKRKIEKQLNVMKKKDISFSYTAIKMIDKKNKVVKEKRNIKESITYKGLLYNTMIATSSVVIDRSIIGDFKMPLRRTGQDYATWLSILRSGIIAYGINEDLVKYRVRDDSLSSNKLKSIRQVFDIQVKEEKINKILAGWHTIFFCLNALKKYWF